MRGFMLKIFVSNGILRGESVWWRDVLSSKEVVVGVLRYMVVIADFRKV